MSDQTNKPQNQTEEAAQSDELSEDELSDVSGGCDGSVMPIQRNIFKFSPGQLEQKGIIAVTPQIKL